MTSNGRFAFGLIAGCTIGVLSAIGGVRIVVGGVCVLFCWGVDQICIAIRDASA